jgi:ABC-type Na+ efflux pump permease subunit
MAIKVACACGKKLSVKDEHAGRRVKCPECQQPLRIPRPKVEEESFDDEWDTSDEWGTDDEYEASPLPARRRRSSSSNNASTKKRKKRSAKTDWSWSFENPLLWVATLVIVGLLVCIVTLINPLAGARVVVILNGLCSLTAFVAFWILVFAGFKDGFLTGLLCWFVPFFNIYFVLNACHEKKTTLCVLYFQVAIMLVAYISLIVFFGLLMSL